ncbi:hypothetical protein ACLNGM_10445 [Aureimonas phyllosphaerae]|uniref:hypothetical protein n=1 Tax=Aureimonas phyllosphaerae TaxID=1166078 RepID=UPI003A5BA8FE
MSSTFDDRLSSPDEIAANLAGHDDRLRDILADPALPDRDKRQAIQEALNELQRERGDELAAAYETLEQRFFDALSLLAEGGHDYEESSRPDKP